MSTLASFIIVLTDFLGPQSKYVVTLEDGSVVRGSIKFEFGESFMPVRRFYPPNPTITYDFRESLVICIRLAIVGSVKPQKNISVNLNRIPTAAPFL